MISYRPGQPVRLTLGRAQRAAEVVCDMPETDEVRIRCGGISRTVPRWAVEPVHLDGDAVAARHAGGGR